jgi:hypothetical protein
MKKHKKHFAKILFLLISVIILSFTIKDSFNQQSTKARIVGSWVG